MTKKLISDTREDNLEVFRLSATASVLTKKAQYIGSICYLDNCRSWMLIDLNILNIAMSSGVLSDISELLTKLNKSQANR